MSSRNWQRLRIGNDVLSGDQRQYGSFTSVFVFNKYLFRALKCTILDRYSRTPIDSCYSIAYSSTSNCASFSGGIHLACVTSHLYIQRNKALFNIFGGDHFSVCKYVLLIFKLLLASTMRLIHNICNTKKQRET